MPDDLRSPIKHHLVLLRIDPEQGIRRFYSLMIERDLFGTMRLVRNWGRIRTTGRESVEVFKSEAEAGKALEVLARVNGGEATLICERAHNQTEGDRSRDPSEHGDKADKTSTTRRPRRGPRCGTLRMPPMQARTHSPAAPAQYEVHRYCLLLLWVYRSD
ncbi:hypothetical protein MAE02_12190 [Microvirga aerophila]|uniref:WGR domain-containing protein n=1 Tax=Microvirga aerophila TaxID=670291 RepID=A0A512BNJ0_9HYPH|nr:hypothetical protein MAE02_12190 [Microvirga aerophila]